MLFPMPPSLFLGALVELVVTLIGELLIALLPKRVKQSPAFVSIAVFGALALVGVAVWWAWVNLEA